MYNIYIYISTKVERISIFDSRLPPVVTFTLNTKANEVGAQEYNGKLAVSALLALHATPLADAFGGASYAARCRRVRTPVGMQLQRLQALGKEMGRRLGDGTSPAN